MAGVYQFAGRRMDRRNVPDDTVDFVEPRCTGNRRFRRICLAHQRKNCTFENLRHAPTAFLKLNWLLLSRPKVRSSMSSSSISSMRCPSSTHTRSLFVRCRSHGELGPHLQADNSFPLGSCDFLKRDEEARHRRAVP